MIEDPIELGPCSLRRLVPGDAVSVAEFANNPKVSRFMRNRFPYPYHLGDAQQFIEFAIEEGRADLHVAIDVGGRAIGVAGLIPGDAGEVHEHAAEIGYWIGEPFWGQGIASAAVRGLTEYAFAHTGLLRIYATVYEGNTASCRVLEKAGYTKEGVLRSHVEKAGEILDAHLYARISPSLG